MRLRNTVTGVTVSVSEQTACLLGQGWQPATEDAPTPVVVDEPQVVPRKRAAKKSATKPVAEQS